MDNVDWHLNRCSTEEHRSISRAEFADKAWRRSHLDSLSADNADWIERSIHVSVLGGQECKMTPTMLGKLF
jgi:hypothetical protein